MLTILMATTSTWLLPLSSHCPLTLHFVEEVIELVAQSVKLCLVVKNIKERKIIIKKNNNKEKLFFIFGFIMKNINK